MVRASVSQSVSNYLRLVVRRWFDRLTTNGVWLTGNGVWLTGNGVWLTGNGVSVSRLTGNGVSVSRLTTNGVWLGGMDRIRGKEAWNG